LEETPVVSWKYSGVRVASRELYSGIAGMKPVLPTGGGGVGGYGGVFGGGGGGGLVGVWFGVVVGGRGGGECVWGGCVGCRRFFAVGGGGGGGGGGCGWGFVWGGGGLEGGLLGGGLLGWVWGFKSSLGEVRELVRTGKVSKKVCTKPKKKGKV